LGAFSKRTTDVTFGITVAFKIFAGVVMFFQKIPSLRIKSLDIGKTYTVINGKSTVNLVVTEAMLGFRFGQFVLTKRLGSAIHIKKKARRVQSKKSR
jgi:hypothetical protein